MKEESEKVGLKINIQKTKIMASGPITSWQIDGESVETVTDFIFWAPKSLQMMTATIKLKDATWKKSMTNLDSIFKSRDITLPTKVCLIKATFFPIVIYGCDSWTIRKVECQKIYAFEPLEKTVESLLDYKEIQPVYPKGNQS